MSLVLMMMMLKVSFSPWTSPDLMAAYLVLVSQLKPALTLLTGVFSCSVHCFVHDLWREENVFVLSCVLAISLALSSIEIFWSLQVRNTFICQNVKSIELSPVLCFQDNHKRQIIGVLFSFSLHSSSFRLCRFRWINCSTICFGCNLSSLFFHLVLLGETSWSFNLLDWDD